MGEKDNKKDGVDEKEREVFREIFNALKSVLGELPGKEAARISSIMDFRTSLLEESDRGGVLMAAAFLDDQLKQMLLGRLVNDKKVSKRAFEFNGPLGTFSSRIDFSYLLGMLPSNARRDLHLVRSIRNKFAHNASPMDLNHEQVKPLCDQLVFHGVRTVASPGSKFRRSVMGLLTLITGRINDGVHIEAAGEHPVESRAEAYKTVSEIYESVTGKAYPLKHEHEGL